MHRRNVLLLLIAILEVTALVFQTGGLGTPSAVLEVTEIESLEGIERAEIASEDYVPALTVLLVNETPFDGNNWYGRNSETREYGYWDTLSRRIDISLLNLTHLTFELQFRAKNGLQTVEMRLGDLTNNTFADANQTQTLILHASAEDLSEYYPQSFSVDYQHQYVGLRTAGVFIRDVEVISFRVWATSTIALVPVSFELKRSNNETLRVHQFAWELTDNVHVDISTENVTALPNANVSPRPRGFFSPWRSSDRVFLPPGNYSVTGVFENDYLTLSDNHSTICRYYVHFRRLSFVPNTKLPWTYVEVHEWESRHREELADSPSIYVRSSGLDVVVLYLGPYLSNNIFGRLVQAIEAPWNSDITITVQLPFITLGGVSMSTSLALFLAAVVCMLFLVGLLFMYDERHERRTRLAVQAGPVSLFVLCLLLPWASGHSISVYGSAYHDVYWTLIPGVLTIVQSVDTGQLIIMPMEPVGLSALWLCLGVLLYSHLRNTGSDWRVQFFTLAIALPLAAVLVGILALLYGSTSVLYLTGPILVFVCILWHVFLVPKRKTGACPEDTRSDPY